MMFTRRESHRSRRQPYRRKMLLTAGKGLTGTGARTSIRCTSCSASCSLHTDLQFSEHVVHFLIYTFSKDLFLFDV